MLSITSGDKHPEAAIQIPNTCLLHFLSVHDLKVSLRTHGNVAGMFLGVCACAGVSNKAAGAGSYVILTSSYLTIPVIRPKCHTINSSSSVSVRPKHCLTSGNASLPSSASWSRRQSKSGPSCAGRVALPSVTLDVIRVLVMWRDGRYGRTGGGVFRPITLVSVSSRGRSGGMQAAIMTMLPSMLMVVSM